MGISKIKLVAADMDGTLLNRDREVTEYTQKVLTKAMKQGVYFVPATGRAVNALPPQLKAMKEIRYGIFSNGATIYDLKEKKVLYKNQFPKERAIELLDWLSQFDLMSSFSFDGQSYANEADMENIDYYELDENTRIVVQNSRKLVPDIKALLNKDGQTVEKITLLFKTMEERERVREALGVFDDIQYSSSLPKNLEISKKGSNKGDGLYQLSKILGIKQEETMACGDADNDREMLEHAGISVVMENGLDSMKAIADYITVSNQEDGVAKAIEKFVLD